MIGAIKSLFSGTALQSIERVATEWIETDVEKAEAKTVMLKALDPNGMMRRQLSRDVTKMYKIYLFTSLVLLSIEFICALFSLPVDITALALATSKLTELFLPITGLFGAIVTASFGVNYANVKSQGLVK